MAPAAPDNVRAQIQFPGTPLLGWYERLDNSYRVRERREAHEFFKTGRVFAMLWAESASATMIRGGTENTAVTIGRFQEEVYSQIRRFVVVKVNRQRHFIYACAISTYGKRGTLKRGCNASEHTAVYLEGSNPYTLQGEWERGMTKDPIMITPTNPQEFMEPTSRLRCGRIYSIEWNVKVKDIGMVATHDRTKLLQYFSEEQENGFDVDDPESSPYQGYSHTTMPNCYQQQNSYHRHGQ
ncbi:uncharacterized protein M421DRAFT_418617 [Didymella exigua CBS 183.55]|uniref:DUF6590 domain-containing protein n=1 Tax=Didymella exigua CBS 183.55 TaxID=1150837 RepID=A0A6A5RRP5_9PLEO|nr:uncharacterized protein M421DRAFT_418617 [Didymella exigua CBS 183.55]KAF1930299.1 hypothetical protein M421DRAFT_418617 [Didymella exigua CBS 183.55]